MKKGKSLIALTAAMALTLSGCGFVTMVPIGEEAKYTGKEAFDAGAESGNDWEAIAKEITDEAVDLTELLNGDGVEKATAIRAEGTIEEYNTDTPKYYLVLKPDGYTGDEQIKVQAGGVYSGTAIRDTQTLKSFEDFTNQTEWSEYAKSLNAQVDAQVIAPLSLDESAAGKKVTLVGVIEKSAGKLTITPVTVTIE